MFWNSAYKSSVILLLVKSLPC